MFYKIHLMQLWFIGWNCFLVHAYANISELISAINLQYKMDHNMYVVENVATGNDIPFAHNAANTIFTSAHLTNNTLQQVFGERVLLMLIFHQLDYNLTRSTLSTMSSSLESDMKIVTYYYGCYSHPRLTEQLLQVFRLFWINAILDVIAVFHCDATIINIFTYNPFGEFTLVNLSNDIGKFYDNKINDFHQHEMNVLITKDIPNIFVKSHHTNKLTSSIESRLGGPDGKMCELFCKKLNVKCRYQLLHSEIMDKMNLTINDIAFNPSPIVYEPDEFNSMKMYSNPVYFDAVVVIVKASKPFTQFMLAAMVYDSQFGFSGQSLAIILVCAILILCILRLRTLNYLMFIETCRDVLSITIKSDPQRLFGLKLQEMLIVLPTIVFGSVIINTVISSLTTFYTTKTCYREDINTLSGLDKLECKIAVSNEHSMKILSDFNEFNWSSRLIFVDRWEIVEQLFNFDTTTCFIDSFRRADVLMRYQARSQRIIHVIKPNLVPQLYGYKIHPMSPQKQRFNDLILSVMSAGLYSKWSSDIFIDLYEENILKHFVQNTNNDGRPSSLRLIQLFWPLNILIVAYPISAFVFCAEIFTSRRCR